MTQLTGKTAIVTGASAGIGRAAARLFAAEGANVVVGARRRAELDALVEEIAEAGGQAVALDGDVCDEAFGAALVETALDRFGTLDIAFNNAGALGAMGETATLSTQGWRDTLDVNLTGAFLCARPQLAHMATTGRGSILFTSSFVGYTAGMPGTAAYAAAKAGLIGLAKTLAAEYGPKGIRVNALLPGGTDTDAGRTFANTPETRAFVESLHGLKRIADPMEIARAALFLASDAASFVTGAAFLADGGVSINRT